MAMATLSLAIPEVWYEVPNLDNPDAAFIHIAGGGSVLAAIEPTEPSETSSAYPCAQGVNIFPIAFGKKLYLYRVSGTVTLRYSTYGGTLLDVSKCAYAQSDGVSIDEVVTNVAPVSGFDDTATNLLTTVGLIHTVPAGVSGSATVLAATLALTFSGLSAGKTYRVRGIESATSVTASLTDYDSLATGLTETTEFVDFTIDYSGFAILDVADIVQELLDDVGSWTTSSPVQFLIEPTGSETAGEDTTIVLDPYGRRCALFVEV
jgi:hypothetical protein